MLAPASLPWKYRWFNLKWGAPSGRLVRGLLSRERRATPWGAPLVGPFAFQGNNTTRAFEYPWAVEALQLRPGLRVLEIGGSLSGFQFVVDRAGCEMIDVDPGDAFHAGGWPVTPATIARLNRLFGTHVTLLNQYLEDAKFPDDSFDRVVSVSVFEHIPENLLAGILAEVRRVLKPGGLLVLTVDLFLDVEPFTACDVQHLRAQRLGQVAGRDQRTGARSRPSGRALRLSGVQRRADLEHSVQVSRRQVPRDGADDRAAKARGARLRSQVLSVDARNR